MFASPLMVAALAAAAVPARAQVWQPRGAGGARDAGASPRLTDGEGRTPLELARARDYAEMVKLLERAGAR